MSSALSVMNGASPRQVHRLAHLELSLEDVDLPRFVIETTGASAVARIERIQSLWGGYGELVRVHLIGAAQATVVVKWAQAPAVSGNDVAHRRKCGSYDVETAFYRTFAARCDASCRVARCLGSRRSATASEWILVLEDLDAAGFARRDRRPRAADLEACLAWLASFHARFVGERPDGLWPVGTYWHLATRRHELAAAAPNDEAAIARAEDLDRRLRSARFSTFVHGDAKPANFCFADSPSDARLAAVDFQYVGGGPGIEDVAYLLHGSSPAAFDAGAEVYFSRLGVALETHAPDLDAGDLEREWRELLPVAVADFERFLADWRG